MLPPRRPFRPALAVDQGMDAGHTLATATAAESAALPLASKVAAAIREGRTADAVALLSDLPRAEYAQTMHTVQRILAGATA